MAKSFEADQAKRARIVATARAKAALTSSKNKGKASWVIQPTVGKDAETARRAVGGAKKIEDNVVQKTVRKALGLKPRNTETKGVVKMPGLKSGINKGMNPFPMTSDKPLRERAKKWRKSTNVEDRRK